jgi:lipopolysaccharide transport system ATP-binding protein
MSKVVLTAENISKQYRLGQLGTGTLSHDLNRWWHKIRGKEDPYLKIGDTNDRSKAGGSDYVWSLKDINFQVNQGQVLGIIGKNGAGKSTLLKILSQVTTPTTGEVKVKGRIASLLEVGTGFHPDLSGRENIFLNGAILGMTKSEIKSKLDEIVEFSGVAKYLDTPVKRYSSGMLVRLGFAVAAHLEPEILIVDEVLAVGDAEFQKKCLGKMKDVSTGGRTVLFVSHNMGVMRSLCDEIILLKNGQIKTIGDPSACISEYMDINNNIISSSTIEYKPDPKKEFQVRGIKLLDDKGELIRKNMDVREKINVEITYHFLRKFPSVHMTLVINDEMGDTVAFFDRTDYAGVYYTAEPGTYRTKLSLPSPLLKPGKYYVTVGLLDQQTGIEDHKFNALSFEIENTTAFRTQRDGNIFIPLEWEIKPL